ncbi:putative disease resistance protein [Vitis vinifera]|uniref:Putative disease resistance protein n=1 Tax=Vitis vinifera TaxID=29760 RepID=A0A438CEU4_VITVI|nr:putative disease resistance protein [Vitis vinifera]
MPTGINRLKDLRRLTTFVVGKDSGARIAELRDLSHLQGALSILNLQDVVNAMDALDANLKKKENLDDLVFAWDPMQLMVIRRIKLEFSKSFSLIPRDCKSCSSLPPLGQLQSLKDLHIVKMDEVQKVGAELYGNNGCSSSSELYIKKCPKLKGDMPKHLPLLTKLEISECGQLVSCLPMAPSICELKLEECEDVVLKEMPLILHNLISLEILGIEGCPILESLPDGMMQNNTTLQHLQILNCGSLRSLPRDIDSLKTLSIIWSRKLELSLLEDMTHNHSATLTRLSIYDSCDSLTSFPLAFFTKLEALGIGVVQIWRGLPTPNLRELVIIDCEKLKSLPQGMHTFLTSLHYLYISNCPVIDSFPEGGLPTNLSELDIRNCNKLVACRMEWGLQMLSFLRSFWIGELGEERLESFPEEQFLPSTLTSLSIRDIPNLKSLDNKGLKHLTSLETLMINNCERLKSLPKQGLPSSLSCLYIRGCPPLKKWCQKDKGKKWPSISHIPCIVIVNENGLSNEEVILS